MKEAGHKGIYMVLPQLHEVLVQSKLIYEARNLNSGCLKEKQTKIYSKELLRLMKCIL